MNLKQYKKHFAIIAKRVEKMKCKTNQLAIGFDDVKLNSLELIGYFHKTRIHRTKLTIGDFSWIKYLMQAGEGLHYAEGEVCQNGQVIRKVVVLKEK